MSEALCGFPQTLCINAQKRSQDIFAIQRQHHSIPLQKLNVSWPGTAPTSVTASRLEQADNLSTDIHYIIDLEL